jgi:phosphoribosyl-AMP cyclohydrolase
MTQYQDKPQSTFAPIQSLQAGAWLDAVAWNEQGLVPAIAQEVGSKDVLMMAWMNRDALLATLRSGEAVYWTRSRQKLWHKGEESGHIQRVKEIRLDCDGDTILLMVEQKDGIACHTGEHSCFFLQWDSVKSAWVDESAK